MTVNRSTVRKQLAELLDTRLSSIVQRVFPYQAGDLRGNSPVIIVTSSGTNRGQAFDSSGSVVRLEVHSFVIYSLRPLVSPQDVSAGNNAIIVLSDTSMFSVAQSVYIDDGDNDEVTSVISVTPNVSITVDLVNSYKSPKVYVWTEEQSEDLLDLIESTVSDEVRLANDSDTWLSVSNDGDSTVDVVDLGGDAYRHEMIPIKVAILDF